MTTRVRIINFGPDAVRVKKVNPTQQESEQGTLLYPGQVSDDVNVYDTSNVLVVEETKPK